MRAFSAGLALLSFVLVCLKGLIVGNSFVSVLQHSLLAMIVGAVGGYLAAMAIQYVVKNEFDRQYRAQPAEESTAAPVQPSTAAAPAGAMTQAENAPRRQSAAGVREMASAK